MRSKPRASCVDSAVGIIGRPRERSGAKSRKLVPLPPCAGTLMLRSSSSAKRRSALMMHRLVVPFLAAVIGLVLAVPALAQPAYPLVKVATDPQLGKILTDSKGMTLYLYSRDTKGVSNCYDQCEVNWPILRPGSGAPTGSSDIGGTLGVIDRTDGTKQVTYNNIPLYYFARDAAPGETKGQAVGGIWWILPPGISQITPAVAQASPAASPAAA